jgi:hypothetical protein
MTNHQLHPFVRRVSSWQGEERRLYLIRDTPIDIPSVCVTLLGSAGHC